MNYEIILKDRANREISLDLFDRSDAVPRIFKRTIDPENLAGAVGDYTLSLKLPKTRKNAEIFGFVDDLSNKMGFYTIPPLYAEIYSSNVLVLKGELLIDKITMDAFEGTIYGGNTEWKTTFDGKKLRELDNFKKIKYSGAFGSSVNQWPADAGVPNLITWADIWLTDETSNEYDLQFVPMFFGNTGYPDPSQSVFAGFNQNNPIIPSKKIFESSGYNFTPFLVRNVDIPWSQKDVVPAPYLKTTLRRIFDSVDYNVSGSFMTSPDTDNIVIPFVGSNEDYNYSFNWGTLGKFQMNQNNGITLYWNELNRGVWYPGANDDFDSFLYGCYSPPIAPQTQSTGKEWANISRDYSFNCNYTPDPFTGVFDDGLNDQWNYKNWADNDTDGYFSDVNGYVVPATGHYRVKGSIIMDNNTPRDFRTKLVFPIDYEPQAPPDYIDSDILNIVDPTQVRFESGVQLLSSGGSTTFSWDYTDKFRKGEFIKPFIWFGIFFTNGTSDSVRVIMSNFEITPILNGDTIRELLDPALFLPDIEISEFVSSISKIFNLEFTIEGNNINIDFKDDVSPFLPITAEDWSHKCDILQANIERTAGQFNWLFEAQDFDNLAIQKDTYNYVYYSGFDRVDTKKIDIPFVTAGERSVGWAAQQVNGLPFKTQKDVNIISHCENEEYDTEMSEVFNGAEINRDQPPTLLKWRGLVQQDINGNLQIGFPRTATDKIPDFSYNLYDQSRYNEGEFPVVEAFDITPKTIFTNYYENTLSQLGASSLVTLNVYLTSIDVNNIDVRRPVEINGLLFRIVEIEGFNPAKQGLTKVKLLKI